MLHHCCISSHTKTYADNPDEQDKQTGQYFDKAWARRGQAGPDKTRRRTTQDPQQRSGQGTAIMASHFFPAALRGFFCRNLLHNTSVSISYSGSHLKQLHWYVCYKYICSLHGLLDLLLGMCLLGCTSSSKTEVDVAKLCAVAVARARNCRQKPSKARWCIRRLAESGMTGGARDAEH